MPLCGTARLTLLVLSREDPRPAGAVRWTKVDCFSLQGSKGWPGLSKHHHPGEAPILGLARLPLQRASALSPQVASLTDAQLRPFSCPFCNSRFKTKQHLVQHQRLHTGEKPYACTQCPARFTQMTPLKRHMAKAHLGLVPVSRLSHLPPPPPSSPYLLPAQHHTEQPDSPPLNSHSPAHKY